MTTKLETYLEQQRWIACYNTSTTQDLLSYAPCFVHGVSTEKMLLQSETDRKFAGSDDLLVLLVKPVPNGYYERLLTRSTPYGCEEYVFETYHKRITGWFGVVSDVDIPSKRFGLVTLDFPAVARCGPGTLLTPTHDYQNNLGIQYFKAPAGSAHCFPQEDPPRKFTELMQVMLRTDESLDNGESTLCIVQPKFNDRSGLNDN